MAALSATEFFKIPSKSRPNRKLVFLEKYKKSEPFKMTDGKTVVFKYELLIYKKIEGLQPTDTSSYNNIVLKTVDGKSYKINRVEKSKEFGGGGGSGAGADLTAVTESGQCFICSFVYNVVKRPIEWEDLTYEGLKEAAKYCETTNSLDEIIEKSPPDWVQSYIKTANLVFQKYKMGTGRVYFHRGSRFMSGIYAAKKKVFDVDKSGDNPQAPGSFSDDKWNPGDIWMTTLTTLPNIPTDSWSSLNNEIYKLAKEKKLLAISLKKVGNIAQIDIYNEPGVKEKTYTYQGFRVASKLERGNFPPFFNSIDLYMEISGREVQFRATSGEAMWQGEIKATTAAGGKIGGGNVNFYLKKHTGKSLFINTEKEVLNYVRSGSDKFFKEFYDLYKKYFKEAKLSGEPLEFKSFVELAKEKQKESLGYMFSKFINMKFIDIFLSSSTSKRNEIVADFFRYAASNTNQSSYFIKVS
jgi:hypothetical protein